MRFIPESHQQELPKVVVTRDRGHTTAKTIYPEAKNHNHTDRDCDYDDDVE